MSADEYGNIEVSVHYSEDLSKKSLFLVGDWPTRALISRRVIEEADRDVLWRDGDYIHIALDNGLASYKIVAEHDDFNALGVVLNQVGELTAA